MTHDYATYKHAIATTHSMRQAAEALNVPFSTFKRYAMQYGLYAPNQGGKYITKTKTVGVIHTHDILAGKHPTYQTYKLKQRLLREHILDNICSECGISCWNNKPLNCELDHINGNRHDHRLENLRLLCPNCHAQTDTYCAKNKGQYSHST